MRDGSGQMYRRNRYYDPESGQFTQPDPIGVAGGLNVYGFAAGDPVTYSDPYGLIVCTKSWRERRQIEHTFQVDITWSLNGCVSSGSAIHSRKGTEALSAFQNDLREVANDERIFMVAGPRWTPRRAMGTNIHRKWLIFGRRYTIVIDPENPPGYGSETEIGSCNWITPFPVPILVAHEFGHAISVVRGGPIGDENDALAYENRYRAALRELNPRNEALPNRVFRCERSR